MMKHLLFVLAALLTAVPYATAQNAPQPAQLRIIVVDETGGGIPAATIKATPETGEPVEVIADERGVVTLPNLPPGPVQLHIEFQGFDAVDTNTVLRRGTNNQTITMRVAGLQEQVVVADTSTDDRRGNSLSTTLDEAAIAELSDDPEELQAQLEALTGGAGATFQVDGFRGGRLPSRDQIRQIRFRTNSFSADNHDAGRVQVEIVTRAGLTAWSGNANMGLRTDVLNARNAFAQAETPEQFRRFNTGLRGPIIRNKTSLRLNVDGDRSWDTATIFAETENGIFRDSIRRPIDSTNVTVGLDHALTRNSTLRFEVRTGENINSNQGVGDRSLIERAFTRTREETQVRGSMQSVLGRNLNEFRVQWNGSQSTTHSLNTAPAIVVLDYFTKGGAGQANETRNKTFTVSDDFDFNVRRHAMRIGVILEGGQYRQEDARNSNGTWTFATLEDYLAGNPLTYTQRLGQIPTEFSQYQLGFYWQDDFRVSRTLSLSVGVRQELQSHLDDYLNLMPRIGYTWNPGGGKTAVRGGYGVFHDWFESDLYDQTVRVNGVDQRDIVLTDPGYPDPYSGQLQAASAPGRVIASPGMVMPFVHQVSIGIERPVTPTLNLQASVAIQRGRNQLRSRDINAPTDGTGVRPDPSFGRITQIESSGRTAVDRLSVGLNYRLPRWNAFIFGNYTLAYAKSHADNPLSLPVNNLDPDAEWGPSNQDVRHRFNMNVNLTLPFAIRTSFSANASSASPFSITTGEDLNRDGVTDRPEGVGRNTARGRARFDTSMRVSRGFSFGTPAGRNPNQGGGGQAGEGGQGGQNNGRFGVEFYANASNLLNRVNYQGFSGNMKARSFMQPTSAGQARRVEVGMQFRF